MEPKGGCDQGADPRELDAGRVAAFYVRKGYNESLRKVRPASILFASFALAALAGANGAMGVALEQYDDRAWLVYVVTTVVFEAWALGRWAGFGWGKAIGVSIAANFATAGCCANLCGVGLHESFVGSRLNPNPLANMALMFLVFGLLSGGLEALVWRVFGAKRHEGSVVLRSLAVHLVWVPVGMAIMLIPERPYPKFENYAIWVRRTYLIHAIRPLQARIDATGRVPDYRDTRRFFEENARVGEPPPADAWAIPYRPSFGRFATGISRDEFLWEWNPAASDLALDSKRTPKKIWLIRVKRRDSEPRLGRGDLYGLVLDEGVVGFSRYEPDLGYGDAP